MDSPETREVQTEGEIDKVPVVGGMHHYYYRRAAQQKRSQFFNDEFKGSLKEIYVLSGDLSGSSDPNPTHPPLGETQTAPN